MSINSCFYSGGILTPSRAVKALETKLRMYHECMRSMTSCVLDRECVYVHLSYRVGTQRAHMQARVSVQVLMCHMLLFDKIRGEGK